MNSNYFKTTFTITISLKARLYVPFDVACLTYDFAAPFELAVAVLGFSYCRLRVSSPAAHLVTAVSSSRTDIALTALGAERSKGIGKAEVW